MNYYIDKRIFVNGKRSKMFMDDPFNLTEYIIQLISQNSLIGARNGLRVETDLVNGNMLNYAELGGPLLSDIGILGSGYDFRMDQLDELFLSAITTSLEGGAVLDLLGDNTSITGETFLNIRTPNVVSSTALKNQVLTLVNPNTGESEFLDRKYSLTFTIADWSANVIQVPQTTHGMGVSVIVQVIDSKNDQVLVPGEPLGIATTSLKEITIDVNGNVTIECNNTFDGRLIIQ